MATSPNWLDRLLLGYNEVQIDGIPLPRRHKLNLVGASASDDGTTTTIAIEGGGLPSGAGAHQVLATDGAGAADWRSAITLGEAPALASNIMLATEDGEYFAIGHAVGNVNVPSGSANNVMHIGHNINAQGTRIDPTKPAAYISIESKFENSPGQFFSEWHWQWLSAAGIATRLTSGYIDHATGKGAFAVLGGFSVENHANTISRVTIPDGDSAGSIYIGKDGGFPAVDPVATALIFVVNDTPLIRARAGDSGANLELMRLDGSNGLLLGNGCDYVYTTKQTIVQSSLRVTGNVGFHGVAASPQVPDMGEVEDDGSWTSGSDTIDRTRLADVIGDLVNGLNAVRDLLRDKGLMA